MLQFNKWYKHIFYASLLIALSVLWIGGYDSGYGSDELDINAYGKANVAYYMSGGKDTTFLHPDLGDGGTLATTLPYYGSGFEYISIVLNKLCGTYDGYEINVRHMLCQFFAVLALLFAGLIARKLSGGYRASIITVGLLFLTPQFTGLSIFDVKDIPFLTCYIASLYYMINFLDEFPSPSWKSSIGLLLALTMTLSIRIGGLLLFMYLFLFLLAKVIRGKYYQGNIWQQNKDWVLKTTVVISATMFIVIVSWPFVLRDPFHNLIVAIQAAQHFPQRIPFNFKGELTDSMSIPVTYVLNIFYVTVPVAILVFLVISLPYLFVVRKQLNQWTICLLLLASVFPIAYVMYGHAALYNGWRHVIFAYPPLIVLVGVGLDKILIALRKPGYKLVFVVACVIGISPAVIWSFKHFPYQFMYYNELVGGFKKAYYNYETDYWQISMKETTEWLIENRLKKDNKDTVRIATNANSCTYYYFKRRHPELKVKLVQCGLKAHHAMDWEYFMINNLFIDPVRLENSFMKMANVIYSYNMEDLPLTHIVHDKNRFDQKGIRALARDQYKVADSFLMLYLDQVKYSPYQCSVEELDVLVALAKLGVQDYQAAVHWAKQVLKFRPDSYHGNLVLGIIYSHTNEHKQKGIGLLKRAVELNPKDILARQNLKELL